MAIPSSGTINLGMLIAEFGGGDNLRDFYRGGGLVPDIAANAAIPTSGQINLRQFLGATASIIGAPTPMNYSGITNQAPNHTGFRLNITTGYAEKYQNGSYNQGLIRWAQGSFNPNLYECMLTLNTGASMSSGSMGTWLQLNAHRLWYLTRSAGGVSSNSSTLVIRRISDAVVMSTSTVNIDSERDNGI